MATSICIITPSGLKCMSSPIVSHDPCGAPVDLTPGQQEAVNKVREDLRAAFPGTPVDSTIEIMVKAVTLMLVAGVTGNTQFTIVRVVDQLSGS